MDTQAYGLVPGLWGVFTSHTAGNIIADRQLSSATIAEASLIAKQAYLSSQSLSFRLNPESNSGTRCREFYLTGGCSLAHLALIPSRPIERTGVR